MITFRKADNADIPLIIELAKKSWYSSYPGIISAEQIDYMLALMYSPEEISCHVQNPNFPYFIIYYNDVPAGFLGFEHHHEKNTTKLHRIYLLAEFKRKGIGKTALSFLKDTVSKTTDNRIILSVNKANPARKVYESQGFSVYDEGVFDIGNGFAMDDYLMEILL